MSKREKVPSTPEMILKKLADRAERKKTFEKTFFPAIAVGLSLLLVYSVNYIAFSNTPTASSVNSNSVSTTSSNSSNSNSSSDNSSNNSNSDNSASNSSTSTTSANSNSTSTGATVKELTASSSVADVVSYFNTAINKVKPNAKKITLNKEENTEAGGIQGDLPKSLTSLANSLISSNMGVKDLSKLDPGLVNATSVEQKNVMFPVENETWSSKLTADDVESKQVVDNGSTYTITIKIKADEPSEGTAHGVGHNGKVFSVVMPSAITANAGGAATIIKEVKTGTKDGYVKVVVDKATGNVTAAEYYFVWTLSIKVIGVNLSIPFGLIKQFTISW